MINDVIDIVSLVCCLCFGINELVSTSCGYSLHILLVTWCLLQRLSTVLFLATYFLIKNQSIFNPLKIIRF